NPFFLYLAYRAPHVPLDAPNKYLDRFPGEMPERRRQALAMIAAMDDGVGAIVTELESLGLTEDTLIFYIGDNGAPLKIHKFDAPGGGPGWDGSLNEPLNGEKGMLTEGGIRVPFLIAWPGKIPAGQDYDQPIIALDASATALHLAGVEVDGLDGVNLIPYLSGENEAAPHERLYWRWLGQSAVRKGRWKYLRGAGREYLFNLDDDKEETTNLLESEPELAGGLKAELEAWAGELSPPGLDGVRGEGLRKASSAFFDWYLDGKRDAAKGSKRNDAKIFEQRDKNRDGKVTLEEFVAGRTEKIAEITHHFHRRDTDKDGLWEKSEIKR
ncbi:MAG: sulfatase-like hydrolase/transferase, partial [Verrucomicrobiales bacterium]